MGSPLVVQEGGDLGIGHDDDVTAGATRPPERLAARATTDPLESDDPGAAVSGAKVNGDFVDEHGSSEPEPIARSGR
jgi:hypothetical protein